MSSKRIKSPLSPTKGSGKSSLLVDQLLQDRKSPTGKKLVLDLNSDNFLITDAAPKSQIAAHEPVIKPIVHKPPIESVILRASPTLHHKPKSRGTSPALNTDSKSKLDIFSAIDSVTVTKSDSTNGNPKLSVNESKPITTDIPAEQSIALADNNELPVETKLKNVTEAIVKLQAKIKAKGRLDKYVKLLEQLEGKVKKYNKQIAAKSAVSATKPMITVGAGQHIAASEKLDITKKTSPVSVNVSVSVNGTGKNQAVKLPVTDVSSSVSVGTAITKPASPSNLATDIDNEIAHAKNALNNILRSSPKPTTEKVVDKKTAKTTGTIFGISSHIDSLKDKQLDLQHKQKELQDKYAFKVKQIDKLKSQHAEIKRLHALEAEKRKIFEMEQKLKRIEKEQWEEQQKIKRDLHKITVANIKPVYSGEFGLPSNSKVTSHKTNVATAPAVTTAATTPSVPAISLGIFKYLADAWNKFAALPLGETVVVPISSPVSPNGETVVVPISSPVSPNGETVVVPISSPVTATPTETEIAAPGPGKITGDKLAIVKNTKTENKSMHALDTDNNIEPPVTVEMKQFKNKYNYRIAIVELDWIMPVVMDTDYILPFDDTWLMQNIVDLVYEPDIREKIQDDYLKQNYRMRLITNLELTKPDRVFGRLSDIGITEVQFICMILSSDF